MMKFLVLLGILAILFLDIGQPVEGDIMAVMPPGEKQGKRAMLAEACPDPCLVNIVTCIRNPGRPNPCPKDKPVCKVCQCGACYATCEEPLIG